MADIFISYSRKDSEQALALAERLRSQGASVWMDSSSLAAAETWSGEIVHAIKECQTMIVLLSPDSIASHNVTKEVGLASEKRKTIIPIELAACELSDAMEYALVGLHRISVFDEEALNRSFAKLGIRATVSLVERTLSTPTHITDTRKSLIVLPFEDLSPTGEDNAWFADGLAGEMIDSLGHIKSLRILDRKTSISLRNTKLRTVEIGKEFNTRYFIEGSVRKFGEQIKISVALLDIETGDYLWQESHRGEFKDIFDIQEAVAEKVVAGLKLHLTKEEKEKVLTRGTENTEAYELFTKAIGYFHRQTKENIYYAVQLLSDTIRLDPIYANAYQMKGNSLSVIYRLYDRNAALLVEAETLVLEALRLNPNLWDAYLPLTNIYQLQGKLEEAEAVAMKYIENAPHDYYLSHFSLGFLYDNSGQYAKAIAPYEQALKIKPNNLPTLWNIVVVCEKAKESEKLIYWASKAIPYFEHHLRFHPDDENQRVSYAVILYFAGRMEAAQKAAKALHSIRDGSSLFNIAWLWMSLGDLELSLSTVRKSIDAGFKNMEALLHFLENDLTFLQDTPEYEEVKQMVEKIEAEQLDERASMNIN